MSVIETRIAITAKMPIHSDVSSRTDPRVSGKPANTLPSWSHSTFSIRRSEVARVREFVHATWLGTVTSARG